jgi:arsenate reductase (thioredoxin)
MLATSPGCDLVPNLPLQICDRGCIINGMSLSRNRKSSDFHGAPPIDAHPRVLFTCSHCAARSIMAAGIFNQLAGGGATATSAGPHPAAAIATHAVAALHEVGIDVGNQLPRLITTADMHAADLVVTLTGVEDLPSVDGVRYEHWQVGGHTETLEEMRDLRDMLSARVRDLLERLTRASANRNV